MLNLETVNKNSIATVVEWIPFLVFWMNLDKNTLCYNFLMHISFFYL